MRRPMSSSSTARRPRWGPMPNRTVATDGAKHRDRLGATMTKIAADLWATAKSPSVTVVSSPPGAGKTRTLIAVCQHAMKARKRVGVACQTNSQADDVCRRLAIEIGASRVCRYISATGDDTPPVAGCHVESTANNILAGPLVVVGTTMKWALIENAPDVDLFLIDEAWQMALASFIPLLRFCDRFILIGDPGQIPPVVSAPTERWETSTNPPHRAAPEVLRDRMDVTRVSLPATWRLPHDTANLIRDFYDFKFESAAMEGERSLRFVAAKSDTIAGVDKSLDQLTRHSIARVLVPMPKAGGLAQADPDVAAAAAATVVRALERKATATAVDRDVANKALKPTDIGVAASHRVMVQAVLSKLPSELRTQVKVDTAERWQGLERELMVVVHPLSSMENPGDFDLETGRLCVMVSRHQSGLVVVGREHIGDTLDGILPVAAQPIGQPDAVARGLKRHRAFWKHLDESERGI